MKNSKFFGTDASNEISLLEYGLLVSPYAKDGRNDEYLVVYRIQGNENSVSYFDTGYITEECVNGYLQGKEFMNAEDIASFLSFVGSTKEEWLEYSFVNKLSDLLQYWGYENIMGGCYYPKTLENIEAITNEKYEA